jgi:DNA-binding MarR family transcriptional regulator
MQESPAYKLQKLVAMLNRHADRLLQEEFGISYKRAIFLAVLYSEGPMTQHQLAVALGYTDPAVSAMLTELTKDGYISITPSPEHGRKRVVSLTPEGADFTARARAKLDADFARLMEMAQVDAEYYSQLTERIYQTLISKEKTDYEPE